jgi:hypothetical protein
MGLTDVPAGGYRAIDGVFQYSGGVAALPGFEIVRARFATPVPLAVGFARIERRLTELGRPRAAFCGCELRSPAPFSEAGFRAFNQAYVVPLEAWGVIVDGYNPVARSNLVPAVDPPDEPSFFAFSYTVPSSEARPSFIVSGSAEAAEGGARYEIVRPGDVSPEGLRIKARFVLGVMEERLGALGRSWTDTTATHVYSVNDVHALVTAEFAPRGCARAGFTWFHVRPPLEGLEYEMDTRAVYREEVLA